MSAIAGAIDFSSTNEARRFRAFLEQPPCLLLAISLGAHAHGRRGRHAPGHDHGRADDRCRGPRGPNALRAIPSLRDSGRNADVSSMPLQTEDAPNVPGPTGSGDPSEPNIRLSK